MPLQSMPPPTPSITSFQEYKQTLRSSHQHIFDHLHHLDNIPHIISCIQSGTCVVVTDGSFYPSTLKAGAAYIIGNEATHRLIMGHCHIVGPPSAFSAYRSELAGLHGGLSFMLAICKIFKISTGRIILACDCEGALKKVINKEVRMQDKHFDYISAIATIMEQINIPINLVHVDGHKDQVVSIRELSLLEQMNLLADDHAKLKAAIPTHPNFESEAAILHEWAPILVTDTQGKQSRLHSHLDKTLYTHLTTPKSQEYWKKKMKIPTRYDKTIE